MVAERPTLPKAVRLRRACVDGVVSLLFQPLQVAHHRRPLHGLGSEGEAHGGKDPGSTTCA